MPVVKTWMYCYDDEGRLSFILEPADVVRYLTSNGVTTLAHGVNIADPAAACGLDQNGTVSAETLKGFAAEEYEYDDETDLVISVKKGACCGGSGATLTRYYWDEERGTDYNTVHGWRRIQQVDGDDNPIGPRKVELLNSFGQTIYSIEQAMTYPSQGTPTITNVWITHTLYYSDVNHAGRVQEVRYSSACTSSGNYSYSTANMSDGDAFDGPWVSSVTPGTGTVGLVRMYGYDDTSKELISEKLRHGTSTSSNAPYWVTKYTYTGETRGGNTIYYLTGHTNYPEEDRTENGDGGSELTTTYSYTWAGVDSHRIVTKTTTYPSVTAAKNGPGGTGKSVVEHYRYEAEYYLYYNDWTKHEDGSYSYTELGTDVHNGGQVVLSIEDVDTSKVNLTTTGFPGGTMGDGTWPLRTGGAHLVTTHDFYDGGVSGTVPNVGQSKSTTYPDGRKTVYAASHQEQTHVAGEVVRTTTTSIVSLTAPHMDAGGDYSDAPVDISVSDLNGRTTHSMAVAIDDGSNTDGDLTDDWDYSDTEPLTAVDADAIYSLSLSVYSAAGQLEESRSYHAIPSSGYGSEGTNYYATKFAYDSFGRAYKTTGQDGTITWTGYDAVGRTSQTWRGTDATGTTAADPDGTGSPNNMKQISAAYYDESTPGSGTSGVGDGNLTSSRTYYGDSDYYATLYQYDWRGRQTHSRGPNGITTERTLDFQGRATVVESYTDAATYFEKDGSDATVSKGETLYDQRGRAYRSIAYDQTGTKTLTSNTWYDARGRQVKTAGPNGLFSKTLYDTAGRVVGSYVCFDDDEATTNHAAALTLEYDTVIEQTVPSYDDAGNVWLTRHFQRNDNGTGEGELTTSNARVSYTVNWFDTLGRTTKTVSYGTNDGVAIDSQSSSDFNPEESGDQDYDEDDPPTGDAPYPRDSFLTGCGYICVVFNYDDAGRRNSVTDNMGLETRTYFDDLGRAIRTVENYDDYDTNGVAATDYDKDRTTEYEYDAKGRLATLIAYNPTGSTVVPQKTCYLYDSAFNASWPTKVFYPDTQDSISQDSGTHIWSYTSGSDHVTTTYDRLGRKMTVTDQNQTTHTYAYSATDGALEADTVTALGSGVDGTVRAITIGRDTQGRPQKITSHGNQATSATDTTDIENQVYYAYDAWGNVQTSWQAHTGAAVTSGTESPKVQYAYEDGASGGVAQYVRLKKVTYPNGREVYYNYANDTDGLTAQEEIGWRLNRVRTIASAEAGTTALADSAKFAEYTYLGAGTIVKVGHPAVPGGLDLVYGSGGTYPGLDRFGRVVDQTWQDTGGTPTVKDRYTYRYDYNSNRLYR
ncbi:MAG: hypothetical protein GXY74_02325, partial [Phycisphaerae bacterium]|nr:hypothetical protein [Phycisphaerae bacterium]